MRSPARRAACSAVGGLLARLVAQHLRVARSVASIPFRPARPRRARSTHRPLRCGRARDASRPSSQRPSGRHRPRTPPAAQARATRRGSADASREPRPTCTAAILSVSPRASVVRASGCGASERTRFAISRARPRPVDDQVFLAQRARRASRRSRRRAIPSSRATSACERARERAVGVALAAPRPPAPRRAARGGRAARRRSRSGRAGCALAAARRRCPSRRPSR